MRMRKVTSPAPLFLFFLLPPSRPSRLRGSRLPQRRVVGGAALGDQAPGTDTEDADATRPFAGGVRAGGAIHADRFARRDALPDDLGDCLLHGGVVPLAGMAER